jgi:thiamine-phosphate pyrophosphorylase
MTLRRGLYALVDAEATLRAGLPLQAFALAVLEARPAALQLRLKTFDDRQSLEVTTAIMKHARRAEVPVYLNDKPELAWLANCEGVHVGQHDMPLPRIRAMAPGLAVGISNHTLSLLRATLGQRPEYAAFGPIFPTPSKSDADPAVGLEALAEAGELARRAGIPLVAIGGIDRTRAEEVARHAELAAVIGALIPSDGRLATVTANARELHRFLGGT